MKTAVVLFSGGMDSTVNLFAAHREEGTGVALALTFDYGQRAARKEIEVTSKITSELGIPHQVLKLPFFADFARRSSLLRNDESIPTKENHQVSIDDEKLSVQSAKSVWVPNRNGIFLNIAAGFAEGLGADWIVPGFNLEEAATFPDNSETFLNATTAALQFSTANKVQAKCFTTKLSKTEIVSLGIQLNVDWKMIWPCYFNGEAWCGQCESCQRSKRAMQAHQIQATELFKGAYE